MTSRKQQTSTVTTRPTWQKHRGQQQRQPHAIQTGQFRSKLEARVFKHRPSPRSDWGYETTRIPYVVQKKYLPDITLTKDNGDVIHIEVKGWFRAEDKAKMRAVKRSNPSLDIRMVFASYKASDVEWCERNHFPFAISSIPKEWTE